MAKTTETFNRSFALSASTTHASARGGVICHEYFQALVRAQCLFHVAWRWGVPLACHTFNRSFALSASTTQDDTHCIQYTTTLSIARSRSVPLPLYCPLCPREQGRVAFNRSFALSASTTIYNHISAIPFSIYFQSLVRAQCLYHDTFTSRFLRKGG